MVSASRLESRRGGGRRLSSATRALSCLCPDASARMDAKLNLPTAKAGGSEGVTGVLRDIFAKVCADFGVELRACGGEDDHVHLLVEYPPAVELPRLVNSLKGVSSRLLRKERPDIARRYWKGVLWSPSYFAASCGGAPLDVIRRYVEDQRKAA